MRWIAVLFSLACGIAADVPLQWTTWAPRPEIAPAFEATEVEGVPCRRIAASSFSQFGKWRAAAPVKAATYYDFSVEYRAARVDSESTSVGALLSWTTADGRVTQRDYADSVTVLANGWRRASRKLQAPNGAASVTIELFLRWTTGGEVLFRNVSLNTAAAAQPRLIRIAVPRLDPPLPASTDSNLTFIDTVARKSSAAGADLVLLGENIVHRWTSGEPAALAQPITGPIARSLAETARRHRIYLATSIYEKEDERVYISAVLFDRTGRLAGKYRKTHIPLSEAEDGITPGNDYPVFETEFGRVGLLVCWDSWFPEPARILRLKGAELLLIPTTGDVPHHWDVISRARAIDNGIPLAGASTQRPTSRILDAQGEIAAETADGIAVGVIDLNREYRVNWLSVGPGAGEAKSLYIKERRPETYK